MPCDHDDEKNFEEVSILGNVYRCECGALIDDDNPASYADGIITPMSASEITTLVQEVLEDQRKNLEAAIDAALISVAAVVTQWGQ